MQESKFGIDISKISHDRLDGEVIVVDLESGSYYCLTDSGADVWTLLVQGLSLGDIEIMLLEKYIGEESKIRFDIEEFIGKLIQIKLIFPIKSNEKNEFQLPDDLIRSNCKEPNRELGWPEKRENN
jgi:hypothetical protein